MNRFSLILNIQDICFLAKDYSILYPPFNVKITDLRILLVYEIARNADVLKPDVSQTELINPPRHTEKVRACSLPGELHARCCYTEVLEIECFLSLSLRENGGGKSDKGLPFICWVPSRFMRKFICRLRLNEVSRQ